MRKHQAAEERFILVVDDEAPVRQALSRILEDAGYTIVQAANGAEALKALDNKAIRLLISDHNMPGMTGVDLLKLVRVRHPHVTRIMMTGESDPEIAIRSINEGEIYRFIRKPWNNGDLRTIVHFAFELSRLEQENKKLLAIVRRQQQALRRSGAPEDPLNLEQDLLQLAEEELREP